MILRLKIGQNTHNYSATSLLWGKELNKLVRLLKYKILTLKYTYIWFWLYGAMVSLHITLPNRHIYKKNYDFRSYKFKFKKLKSNILKLEYTQLTFNHNFMNMEELIDKYLRTILAT